MKELSESYEPKTILFREEEIKEIKEIHEFFERDSSVKNKIVQGGTGSGKTTITKRIFRECNKDNDISIFISCADLKTSKKVFKKIYSGSFSEAIEKFRKEPKIMVFDEINKLNNIEEFFDDLNTFYRETGCPIVLITNRTDLTKKMKQDAYQTLHFSIVLFKPYNALQIKEILKNRIDEAKLSGNFQGDIPEDVIPYISALVGNDGSLRDARDLLNTTISSKEFSQESIKKNYTKMQTNEAFSWIDSLNETEKAVLKEMISICLSHETDEGIPDNVSYRELVLNFTKKYGRKPQRVSQIIKKFEEEFFIESKDNWLGRSGGKNKILKFSSESDFGLLIEKFYPDGII
jgi:archaeal cell division control protein 6